jgi:hypothetical protein
MGFQAGRSIAVPSAGSPDRQRADNRVFLVKRIVGMMRRLSSHFPGDHPIEHDPTKRMRFSARKSCVEKRMSIWHELVDHQKNPCKPCDLAVVSSY